MLDGNTTYRFVHDTRGVRVSVWSNGRLVLSLWHKRIDPLRDRLIRYLGMSGLRLTDLEEL